MWSFGLVDVAISAHCFRPSSLHSSGLAVASCDSFFMNFAFARRTELMLNVKLFRADMDLVNLTMLLPMVEIGAEAGPVTLLFKGTSNVRPVDSLRKSGEEQGDEELMGESGGEAIVEEDDEEDIVGEEELGSLSLGSIFGDISGEEVEDNVGGGTEGSNSDMVARLFLMRPMLKQL